MGRAPDDRNEALELRLGALQPAEAPDRVGVPPQTARDGEIDPVEARSILVESRELQNRFDTLRAHLQTAIGDSYLLRGESQLLQAEAKALSNTTKNGTNKPGKVVWGT